MAADSSFDVVSKVNMEEVRNAIEQTQREVANRFDFKNSVSSVELEKEVLKLHSDDEFKMQQLVDRLILRLPIFGGFYHRIDPVHRGSSAVCSLSRAACFQHDE